MVIERTLPVAAAARTCRRGLHAPAQHAAEATVADLPREVVADVAGPRHAQLEPRAGRHHAAAQIAAHARARDGALAREAALAPRAGERQAGAGRSAGLD